MRMLLAGLVVLSAASLAMGAATVQCTSVVDLSEECGLPCMGYTLTAVADDGDANASFFVNITIECCDPQVTQMRQVKAFGAVDVNIEADANTYQGLPGSGYLKACDTWWDDDFTTNGNPQTGTTWGVCTGHIESGTKPAFPGVSRDIAYVVICGDQCFCWSGVVSRQGVNYNFDACIPEPATLLLLCSGAGLLMGRRRMR